MEFSTPFTCCSIGVATDCSTSSALAPTYVVVTWMSGGVMSGYCEMGRRESETAPTMTVTIEITIATMGRRMKKFPIGHLEEDSALDAAAPMLAAAGTGPACGGGEAGSGGGGAPLPPHPAPAFFAPFPNHLFPRLTP